MGVAENLKKYANELRSSGCSLIAVSKTKPTQLIIDAHATGHLDYGENKVQDLVAKFEELPKDIRWHMIGHLQRNKVKYITPFVHLIHGIDSEKLLLEVNKHGERNNRVINCLLQVHIAEEEAKFGFNESEILEFLDSKRLSGLQFVNIKGMMGMATFTNNDSQIRREFRALKLLFDKIKANYSFENLEVDTLSMGMSADYKLAIEEGSNMVRIGTAIFGERNYP